MSFGIIDIIISDLIDGIIPVTMENINGAQGGVPEARMERRPARLGDAHIDVSAFAADVDGAEGGADREDVMEAMLEKIRQLESQLQISEEGVATSPPRRDDRISTPPPAVARRQPNQPSLFQKVPLPSYNGENPSLYGEFENWHDAP